MKPRLAVAAAAVLCAVASVTGHAAKPHEHGVAKLDIAVAGSALSVMFDSPLDNLVGFERAPRTDAERQRVDAAVATVRAAQWLRIDGAAACTLGTVVLEAPVLGLGAAQAGAGVKAAKDSAHADLSARFDFNCKNAAAARQVEVGLFEAFPRLQRIEVQVAGAKGQMQASLRKPATRVALVR